MFESITRFRLAAQFLFGRVGDYARLAALDIAQFRIDLVRTLVGYSILLAAGLVFLVFLSVAVIVTAWESESRILVAWLVCLFWALIAAAGLIYARGALRTSSPFADLSDEITQDLNAVKEIL